MSYSGLICETCWHKGYDPDWKRKLVFGQHGIYTIPNDEKEPKEESLTAEAEEASSGPVDESFNRAIAKVWSGILAAKLHSDVTPREVALLLAAFKICREASKPSRFICPLP